MEGNLNKNIRHLTWDDRESMIRLTRQFHNQINKLPLDGVFKLKKGAAVKYIDIFLKLSGTGKVLLLGFFGEENELLSMILCRTEEKPYLEEEKTLFIDLAVTKLGHKKKGLMRALLDETIQWARSKKILSIELRAISENTEAVDFWAKMGFHPFFIRYRKTLLTE